MMVLFSLAIGMPTIASMASSREEMVATRLRDLKDDSDNDNDDDVAQRRRRPFGSCREARLCCQGRDASCQVQNTRINSIIEALGEERSCFCDHGCLATGDCCPDYKQTCGVQDCVVSDWSDWSDCDVSCGVGTSTRNRRVLRQPQNGGQECPETTQKRSCHGFNCEPSTRATLKASRETALILASRYSSLRVRNESRDITWNLKLAYPKDPVKESSHEYCVVFEVTKTRKGCEIALDNAASRTLQVGSQVCVACQSAAWRKHLGYRCHGHGVDDRQTRWTSIAGNNCHGRWVRQGAYEQCPCHADGHPDFIFV
ncbi:Somatomedin-B and thrombospondin type-1 domain-containing protein [Halotydeus destructor]|nr:Somatomedin-B and thrombospondin type-1 domain-containing protein [Halotydeus destructor]